jgi:heme oxygenase
MQPLALWALQAATSAPAGVPLSAHLREATARFHERVERQLKFPESISTLDAYRRCLGRFYSVYRPIEALFANYPDWPGAGIVLRDRNQSVKLAQDLAHLRVPLSARTDEDSGGRTTGHTEAQTTGQTAEQTAKLMDATSASLPRLPSFAHALGGLYVLEGSTLGAQFLLPRLKLAMGDEIAGAERFFSGHCVQYGAFRKQFRTALDLCGETHPANIDQVIDGARSIFTAIGNWMQS